MTWVAVVTALVAAAGTAYNTNRTAKKQDKEAARGIQKQAENQRIANARLNKSLQFAETSKPDEARKVIGDQYLNAVRGKLQQSRASLGGQGGSSAYEQEASAAAAQNQAGAFGTAGLMAAMDAPAMQRQGEQFNYGNLGMDLSALAGNVQGDEFLNRLRVGAIRRNPYIDAGAAALAGYGSSRGGGSGPKG